MPRPRKYARQQYTVHLTDGYRSCASTTALSACRSAKSISRSSVRLRCLRTSSTRTSLDSCMVTSLHSCYLFSDLDTASRFLPVAKTVSIGSRRTRRPSSTRRRGAIGTKKLRPSPRLRLRALDDVFVFGTSVNDSWVWVGGFLWIYNTPCNGCIAGVG